MSAYALPTFTAALLLAAPLIAPRAAAGAEVEQQRQPLIYGADSRVEAHAHSDAALRELSRSVVALIQRSAIHVGEEGVEIVAPRLAETIDFCDEERFTDQPVLADCSGVLVGADLVLTAGHCVDSVEQCRDLHVVRDYALDAAGALTLEPEGIHACADLVAREVSNIALPEVLDYALLRIEPPVEGVRPIPVRDTRLSQGDPVVLVGHGLGLPTKIDDAARVVDPRDDVRDYFGAQFDLFHRGSGSGVFDSAGNLAGIAVRGGTDFDGEETCASLRRVPMESSAMEEATYASAALERSGLAWPASEEIFAKEQALPEAACSFSPGRRAAGAWLPMLGLLAVVLRRRRPFDPEEGTQSMRKP